MTRPIWRVWNILRAIVEVNERCWRDDECDLCDGVRQGLGHVAAHTQHHSGLLEQRVGLAFYYLVLMTRTNSLQSSTLESLKVWL